ncbi:MAG: hypothetical protein ACTHMX_12140 [Thermomicrobiales bacterium]
MKMHTAPPRTPWAGAGFPMTIRSVAMMALVALFAFAPALAFAQNSTPVSEPTPTTAPEATTPPVVEPATGAGSPAILATGLVYLPGTDVVWSVEEKSFGPPADAKSSAGPTTILYQRTGTAIVRNDLTAKRAQVDPGAAFFLAADDPYTISGGSAGMGAAGATAWAFRIGAAADVPAAAFYEGPPITGIKEGTYSLTLTRYVRRADEQAQIGAHTGSALVMVTSGQVDVDVNDGQGANRLVVGDGKTVANTGTVHNSGASPAVYVVLAIGGIVSDETAGVPRVQATAAVTEASGTSASPNQGASSQPDQSSGTVVPTPGGAPQDSNGNYLTSINVTAVNSAIYVVVTADGVTVFDGNLEPGQMTGAISGSTFTVYTSIGAAAEFTNACGETFFMGNEPGEATYTLTATASSCPPQT